MKIARLFLCIFVFHFARAGITVIAPNGNVNNTSGYYVFDGGASCNSAGGLVGQNTCANATSVRIFWTTVGGGGLYNYTLSVASECPGSTDMVITLAQWGMSYSKQCGTLGGTTQFTAVGAYTNQTLMVQTVGLRLTFGTNAQPVTNFVTLLPGNTYSFAVTNGSAFSWSVVNRKLEADGLFDYPVASGNGQSQTTFTPGGASSSGLGSFGDTFGSTQQPQGFNPLSSGLTNVTRATDFSDTTKAVQTLDSNQQARQREMVSVLMNFENERWRRDAAGINAQAQNAQLVADSSARAGSTVAAAVEGLRADLAEGMGDAAQLEPVGDPLTTSVGLRAGLAPSLPTVGVGTAQLVVPLAALQLPGLSDHTIDFRQGDLAGWVGTVRAVGVAIVTVAFTVATYRLLFSTGG